MIAARTFLYRNLPLTSQAAAKFQLADRAPADDVRIGCVRTREIRNVSNRTSPCAIVKTYMESKPIRTNFTNK